jgi:hypothetical protein
MKRLLLIVLPLLLIVGCSKKESSFKKMLIKVSNEVNKNTPTTVDKYTTLQSSAVLGEKSFLYLYIVDKNVLEDFNLTKSEWRKSQVTFLTNFYCNDSSFGIFKDNNANVTWKYNYIDGSPLTEIEINNNDCYN